MMNSHTSDTRQQCWIGLAHVKPKSGNNLLGGSIGAFVPILALSNGMDNFISITTTWLESYDFNVIEIEEIEPFTERLNKSNVEDELKTLSEKLTDKNPVVMDVFQAYDNE